MLAVDALYTIFTTVPINIFPIFHMIAVLQETTAPFPNETLIIMKILYGVALINCFITPIFYYIFNQAIQVSKYKYIYTISVKHSPSTDTCLYS